MTTTRKASTKPAKPAKAAAKQASRRVRVVTAKSGQRKPASVVLGAVHASVAGLHRAGVVQLATMREFDALCLAPVLALAPSEIAALRRRERVSQPVFARYLNVSKSSVSQWEIGEKKPDGAALKLLDLVRRKGLDALA
jgi:putative transcriptional regulator